MNDWCDRTAAQILVAAYTDPNARDRIVTLLKMTFVEGQIRAIKDAERIVTNAFERRS